MSASLFRKTKYLCFRMSCSNNQITQAVSRAAIFALSTVVAFLGLSNAEGIRTEGLPTTAKTEWVSRVEITRHYAYGQALADLHKSTSSGGSGKLVVIAICSLAETKFQTFFAQSTSRFLEIKPRLLSLGRLNTPFTHLQETIAHS